MPGADGRYCPQVELSLKTVEGGLVWDAVRTPGAWKGGGLVAAHLDRTTLARRLEGMPGWIMDPLLDAFEAGALAAMKLRRDRDKQRRARGADDGSP